MHQSSVGLPLLWLLRAGVFALCSALLFGPNPSQAFMFKKIVYCSPIQGQLLLNGKPLAGIQVTRTLYSGGFSDNKNIDHATSDGQGRYRFPEVSERRLFRPDLLSGYPSVVSHLQLNYQSQVYNLWSWNNRNYEIGSETGYPEIQLESDLSKFEKSRSAYLVESTVRRKSGE